MQGKIKCLVVDDDPMMLKVIGQFVSQTDFLELSGSCQSPMEAVSLLMDQEIQLLFLDVEMPVMSGIELIGSLHRKPQIVLITSKQDYAVEAFDLDVADYILKPPDYSRFLKAVNRVVERIVASPGIPASGQQSRMFVSQEKLFIKVDARLMSIPVADICFVEAKADYVTIHTPEKRFTVYSTMKGIESKLPQNKFLRVHRSFIINLNKLDSVEDNTLVVGQVLVPIGVTYREKLMNSLNLL